MNTIADIKKTAEQKMTKSVEALKHDLSKVRTGRAHTGLLDHLNLLSRAEERIEIEKSGSRLHQPVFRTDCKGEFLIIDQALVEP